MISEIFSTSFLFSIAICIILVGGLFAYFNYRFSEQNHKMQSMLGLVSTMAEEMQYFRSKLSSGKQVDSSDTMDNIQVIPNFLGGNGNIQNMLDNELIEVSDSEVEDDIESEVEDEDEDEDDEEDDDINSEVEDDIDSEIEDDIDSEVEELETDDNKKIINIDLGTTNNDFVIESEEIDLGNNTNDNAVKNISIDLDLSADEMISTDELNLENMESTLKSISIDDNVSSKGKEDYKKMSLNKLRDIVCAKGLVVDASKLKKNELLKLLGDE
jgi:hypothetical protein